MKNKIYKKWWFWLIIVIILFSYIFTSNSNTTQNLAFDNTVENLSETQRTILPNSNEMVDYLILKAKQDAQTVSSEEFDNALFFIENNINNLHKDNETMEKAIYFRFIIRIL